MSDISVLFSIEHLMYFGIGFLAATVISIVIVPFALKRAERLTRRRVISTMPLSLNETAAEKDALRATFAVAVRKLELRTDELVKRVAAQASQLGRNNNVNTRLKEALDEKSELVAALEIREGALMSRENSLIRELLALRDEARINRDSLSPMHFPPARSPWN